MDLKQVIQVAEDAAREAGRLLEEWGNKFTVSEKSRANLVTEADFAAQQKIHEILSDVFPDHGYLGEEGLSLGSGESGCRWIIDPLDGTGNYVHRFPYYGVSIALEVEGILTAGVVYDPNRDELFTAVRGAGAALNGSPISVSTNESLDKSLLMASLPVASDAANPSVERFLRIMPQAQSVQRSGSAALNLSNVAAGRLDGFWSTSLKPWDMAAGVLLVEEAGGSVTKISGSPFQVDEPDLLATNGLSLHAELEKLLP